MSNKVRVNPRNAYGEALVELGGKYKDLVVLDADLSKSTKTSLQMINSANDKIKELNPDAFIIWAGGKRLDNKSLSSPSETNDWYFIAATTDFYGETWLINYNGKWLIKDYTLSQTSLGYSDLLNVKMDLNQAWEKAKDKGYKPPFNTWELLSPYCVNTINPLFVFSTSRLFFVFYFNN